MHVSPRIASCSGGHRLAGLLGRLSWENGGDRIFVGKGLDGMSSIQYCWRLKRRVQKQPNSNKIRRFESLKRQRSQRALLPPREYSKNALLACSCLLFVAVLPPPVTAIGRCVGLLSGVRLEVGDDALDVPVVLQHLLVVAAALLVGTRAHIFAHDAVQVPLSTHLPLTLQHPSEFDQEINVAHIFLRIPVRSGEGLSGGNGLIQAEHHFLWSEHPRLELGELRNHRRLIRLHFSSSWLFGFKRTSHQ